MDMRLNSNRLGFAAGLAAFALFWAGLQGGYYRRFGPEMDRESGRTLRDAPGVGKAATEEETVPKRVSPETPRGPEASREVLEPPAVAAPAEGETAEARKSRERFAAAVRLPPAAAWQEIDRAMRAAVGPDVPASGVYEAWRQAQVRGLRARGVAIREDAQIADIERGQKLLEAGVPVP